MLKVVIIDDEPLVLEGLRTMVDWTGHGYKIIGEAINGEEGFDLISESNPDLVITDMRMPIMDGLVLIEKCRNELELHAEFVILSGYSEFEYAKKALELNSHQYLLKPIDSDDIHKMLDEVKVKIEMERTKEEKIIDDLKFVLDNSIRRLLLGEVKEPLLNRIHFILNTNKNTHFTPGYLHFYPLQSNRPQLGGYTTEEVVNKVHDQLEDMYRDQIHIHYKIIETNKNGLMFVSYGEKKDLRDSITSTRNVFCSTYLEERCTSLMMLQKSTTLECLSELVAQVKQMKGQLFYGPKHHLYKSQPKKAFTSIYQMDLNMQIQTFEGLLIQSQWQQITCKIEQIAHEIRLNNIKPDEVRDWVFTMLERVCHLDVITSEGKDWLQKQLLDLKKYPLITMTELKTCLKAITSQLQAYVVVTVEKDPIMRIKTYVNENYAKDIKIKHIGSVFGFNPVYIGQLFQKHEGIKYNDYVTNVRMDKGVDLLKYTNMKIKEIALLVGYKNPDYFIIKFKEIHKVSPKEYRRINQV